MPKTEFLIVDTSAFIKNAQLQGFADKIVTCQDVVDEIKSSRQMRRLVVLPYELEIDEPDNEDIVFVSQFSKKTGDYPVLSATDIKVVALAYKYERLKVGADHLNEAPAAPADVRLVDHSVINDKSIVGFYMPKKAAKGRKAGEEKNEDSSKDAEDESSEDDEEEEDDEDDEVTGEEEEEEVDDDDAEDVEDQSSEGTLNGEQEVPQLDDEIIARLSQIRVQDSREEQIRQECDQSDPCALDADDAGWITPSNVKKLGFQLHGGTLQYEVTPITVACLTTDFAMQNVLKQIGLKIVSLDGMLIKQVKTWILRCYACFKTTPEMARVFCRNCGNKTLKRVAVTVDKDGKEHIHINFRRPLTARGKRFPLPRFRGGKHSNNPVLSEDQRVPHERVSTLANKKTNAMDPDYIAGMAPFSMRDVCSKSAMLGITNKELKSWERKNPNVVVKRRRKK